MAFFFKKNFLPQSFDLWFKKITSVVKAILIFCLTLFFFVSLFTYSPIDESFNSSSTLITQNKLDWPGAYSADIWMQLFGFASYYMYIMLLLIAYSAYKLQEKKLKTFLFFSFLSTFLMGCAFNLLFLINGGFIAYGISSFIFNVLTYLKVSFLSYLFGFLFLIASLFMSLKAFNKTLRETKIIAYRVFEKLKDFAEIVIITLSSLSTYLINKARKQDEIFKIEKDIIDEPSLSDIISKSKSKRKSAQKTITEENEENQDQEKVIHEQDGRFSGYDDLMLSNGEFHLPGVDLLDTINPANTKGKGPTEAEKEAASQLLQTVLEEFGIKGEIVNIKPGPVVTMYELKPAAGIKTSRVISLADDIARSMSALSARIAVIPGQNLIGIELPNSHRVTVFMRELLLSEKYHKTTASLPLILGKDIGGEPVVADLARMPHLLVAGTTGSGKSVSVNAMILSILFKLPPEKCRFIMIDPKMLELSIYDDIPHLLTPVVTDPKKAVVALKWAVKEMENRYQAMSKLGVRNIDGYNARVEEAKRTGEMLSRRVQTGFDPDSGKPIYETQNYNFEPLPFIIVVVDEMADLMLVAGKEIESAVQRLAQMARAAGIHLIMATQRPSVDVITGTIKANFPTRISFMVTSKIDSRTILGEQGAEQLLGQGDMLYMAGGGRIQRVHGPYMKDVEVERVVKFLHVQGEPSYIDQVVQEVTDTDEFDNENDNQDPVYKQAVDLIRREGKVSTSFIQRHLSIGYNRAARIVDQMEAEGIVSPANHTGKREILIP